MANNNAFIQFKWGTLENFNSLQNKDINTVYFLDDGSLYLGNQFIGKDYEYGDYSTSWPLNPIIGKLYIDVSTGEIRDYDGTDWTTIIDPSVFGEKSYYDNKSKKAEYLYEMDYSILDYEAAKTHFLEQRNSSLLTGTGACSSVVSNGFAGRNFDWFYNSDVTVVIHTPQVTHIEDNVQTITRHAVLGVAGGHAEITKETIESGENSELYKYIPFYLLDGINDAGLYCNINVVPLENGYTSYSNPTGSEEEELCVLMLSRYVLDKFSSASEAATYIQQHVKVYGAGYLDTVHYGIHMMISDGTSTKVLEFINGETVITDSSIMTNFMIDGVTFEADGSVLTNPAVSGDATPSSKGVSMHGSGLERWNILNANKSLVNSIDSMGELMASIKYSQTYTNGDNNDRPVWYSELCNDSSHGGNELNVDTVITDTVMTNVISTVRGWYQNRARGDMKTWHTAHSSAYDFATKSLRLTSQEEFDAPYYFYLADTLNELDIKINKIKQEFKPILVETTYSDLVNLRDSSKLVPGTRYRITDYVTTTAASNTRSTGHAFDIIVTADDVNMLNENAYAALHEDDTYFANSKLEAWELKYCLDNDTNRFDWADTSNGKGVVYYMKDEFNNECPYDFKNIQFMIGAKSNAGTYDNVYYYTFSVATDMGDMTITDHSLNGAYCYGNSFKEYIKSNIQRLNFIVCRNIYTESVCYGNSAGVNCYDIACGDNCIGWSCGDYCYDWTCGDNCYDWTCGNDCYNWSCGDNSSSWTCGNECSSWTCGNDCYNWSCGDYSSSWTCGDNCYDWTCGNDSHGWSFGSPTDLKSYYRYIMIDDGCSYFYLDTIQAASESNYVQNIHICQGFRGIDSSSYRKTITIDTVNNDYTIRVENDSNGNMLIYNLPDEIQGAVKYDSSQSLTSVQKSQACSNIGAVSTDNFITDGLYMRKNSAWAAVTKADLLTILGGTVETWTFTDDNNVQYEKEIIVLN